MPGHTGPTVANSLATSLLLQPERIMRIKPLFVATLFILGTGAALAQSQEPAALSRAEVQADLQIWQLSGLADLDRRDSPDTFSQRYREAARRYAQLRASPAFAARVAEIAGKHP